MNKNESSLKGYWLAIVLFGLVGQIAWAVENMYFNIFIFNFVGGTTTDIANMVAASAITATLTALFMGALSDRMNKRKVFICVGTILWGISVLAFAFISRENVALLLKTSDTARVTAFACGLVIFMDCVMTFFGSTSNDGAFNSWVTNITSESNRGKVEGVLSCLPMVALLLVVGGSGILISAFGYPTFFIIIGCAVILCGVSGIFLVKESTCPNPCQGGYLETLCFGFKPSTIAKNCKLYLLLITLAVFSIGVQVFMPYLIVYMEKYLLFDALQYSIVLGVGIALSSVFGIFFGKYVDKLGKKKFFIPAIAIYIVGLCGLFFARSVAFMIIVATVTLCGNLMVTIIINSSVRDNTPKDMAGLFQGVRLFFLVLIPMVCGPYIGNAIIKSSSATYVNEFAEVVNVPVPAIFLVAGVVTLFAVLPMKIYFSKNKES